MDQTGGLTRDTATWVLYAVLSCMSFLLNGMGAVLAPLQDELGVDRAQVAFYPTLFAAGLLLIGLVGGPLVGRAGRVMALRISVVCMIVGGLLLATPVRSLTLVGALLLGIGGALLVQLVPALLGALHPHAATAAVGEANGLASAVSVLAPLAVAGALAAGLGWQAGYLVAPLVLLAVVALVSWNVPMPNAADVPEDAPAGSRTALIGPWVEVLLSVSVEFCMVFWAASAVGDWHHASSGLAPAVAALFLVGMAVGRSLAVPVTRRVRGHRTLLLGCTAIAAAGFALFWAAPDLPLAGVGLAVAGLGVSLLYPTTVSRTIAAWPHAPDRAAARAAMASGLAVGGAPFLLARLSDTVSLRTAYLIVPALLVALAARTLTSRA